MKLSVIIPIYNTEKYLEKCILSVINQDMKDLEIILVDDGSDDFSPIICDKYALQYNFIQAFHITNSGPATAKNIGYSYAKGEYISFIDSDDELMPNMYSRMLINAYQNQADIVCCSYKQIDENGITSHKEYSEKEYKLNQVEGLKHLLEKNMIYSQCWTKIYRKKIIEANNILFVDGLKTEEDFIYNLHVFLNSNIITIVDIPLYIYTHRACSLSRAYFKSHLENFHKNMIFRLAQTNYEIKTRFPQLSDICAAHCIQYYNLLIGRACMFEYKESKSYYLHACNYIRKHAKVLFKYHTRCGFSFTGAILFILLPPPLYFKYRQSRVL